MADVPYASLLNRRIPAAGRQLVPAAAGVYAWWSRDDIKQAEDSPYGASVRPLYIGAARNLAASVTDDAAGPSDTFLRKHLATDLSQQIGLRPRTSAEQRPLTIGERQRIDHWISANLLVSWSELPHPTAYRDALVRALDPQFKPKD
ncbi:hypothetical protein NG819_02940 [Pseudarthrobacter sp. Fe7]|nr:hypothetical protein NG819_02940 [Pseudarthrobacter sp. Fe7]